MQCQLSENRYAFLCNYHETYTKTSNHSAGPILRLLASNWIFKEVEPDVFANNRLSSVMHKGQTAETLQKSCVTILPSMNITCQQDVFAAI